MTESATGGRRTQRERREEAERRLVDAAAALIGEQGPTRTTLTDIGKRAGYSRGLTTHHFGSKGALISRILNEVTNEFYDDLAGRRQPADDNSDPVLEVIDTYFDGMRQMKPLTRARLVLWADATGGGIADSKSALVETDRRFVDEITARIQETLTDHPDPPTIDARGFATLIVSLLRGTALLSILDGQVDVDACHDEARELVISRLRLPHTSA